MNYAGHVENGVIVLDGKEKPPEGMPVVVRTVTSKVYVKDGKRCEIPLIWTGDLGTVYLTNDMIAEYLDEIDASA